MSALFSGQLDSSIVIGDGETVTIKDDVITPIGQPAVGIQGDDATLQVQRSGSVSAPDPGNTAVLASGSDATIANAGEIAGDFNGISSTGDDLHLNNSGTISSNSRAVDLSDGDGLNVRNSGEILGTDNQRNGTLYVDGTVDDLNLVNTGRGVIDAGEGNLGDAVSVQVGATGDPGNDNINILNNGLLQGRGDGPEVFDGGRVNANGSSGLRFFNGSGNPEATVSGTVRNNGTITAEVSVGFLGGLVVEDGVAYDGRIVNGGNGMISGPNNGLYIGNANHDLDIINRGLISSGSRAVNIDGSGVNLFNFDSILGTGNQRNGTVYTDSTAEDFHIINARTGRIDAGVGNQGGGIVLQVGDESGDVVAASLRNNGLVRGRGDGEGNLEGDGIRLFAGIADGDVTLQTNIDNRGRIVASDDGIEIQERVTLDGNVINRGTIAAENDGILIDGVVDGNINNSGVIQAGDEGIEIDGDGVVGNINNRGSVITNDGDAIEIDGTVDNINNRGTLFSRNQDGIDVDPEGIVHGNITNYDSIISQTEVGIRIDGTVSGSINNFGLIEGAVDAIFAEEAVAAVTVNNHGTLNGNVVLSNFDDVINSSRGDVNGSIFGLAGNDRLIGGRDLDVLVGGEGDDYLTGGRTQTTDTFVFAPTDFGADTVTDFQNGLDLLDVSAFNFGTADLQAVISGAQQIGSDTLLTFAANNTVLLQDIKTNVLDTSDFIV